MKYALRISGCILFFLCLALLNCQKTKADDGWKNYYLIAWRDTSANSVKYAKQMGYDYIAAKSWTVGTYKNNPDCAGLKYYIVDPHFTADVYAGLPNRSVLGEAIDGGRFIDISRTYTQEQKDWYNSRMVWKSNDSFPYNFATGYIPDSAGTRISVMWDVQQQAVIDELVEKIIRLFKSYERQSLPFTFAGYVIDVPMLSGDFMYLSSTGKNVQTTLEYWTGSDSGLLHDIITHEYPTYTEGMAAFYKQLNTEMRQKFPDAKWLMEPSRIYDSSGVVSGDEWVYSIKNRADKNELTPDFISQEGAVTDFVDNSDNFNSGLNITRDMVGCSQNSAVEEDVNRQIAVKAGMNGAWYNWFGRFGGSKTMPDFQGISDVYPRLKLVRCIPNWDNLNKVPLTDRSWDGNVYQSSLSYISRDVMYSRHPKTGKLFAVFLTTNGVVKLNSWESVTSVRCTDGYFVETVDARDDFNIIDNEVRLKSDVNIANDPNNGQIKGNGYIFTLSDKSGVAEVITGPATNVTADSVTLTGMVNANGIPATVWFEYDTTRGVYGMKSLIQEVNGSSNTDVAVNVNDLSSGNTYYYRIMGQNSQGIIYGSERSFTTLDNIPPDCSLKINDDNPFTKVAGVVLNLSATDNTGVTGYFISTNSTPPLATASGWTSITLTTDFSLNKPYTLSSVNGIKTLYFWCKDAADNVSNGASASITYDSVAPKISLTSPITADTFSTRDKTIRLGGTASDSTSGINKVTWSNDKSDSGTAIGTSNWTTDDINLTSGNTIITITATDEAGNTGTDTVTVTMLETLSPDALQIYYPLNDGTGTVARDVSGKGNHGTIAGATWTTGKIGGGLEFNGTSHYISVPRVDLDELSISGWFYKNAKDTTNADAIFSAFNKGTTAQEGYEIRFIPSEPDTIEFMLITQNSDGTRTSKIARNNLTNSVGKWYHVAGVYCKSTGEQKLYVNGQLVSTLVHSPGNTVVPLTSYSDMRIGYSRVSTGYFNGSIDDILIYNGVLSDQEILDLYNSVTDSTVPSGSIVINDGASYSNSSSVTLNLLATDNIGVTGYCLSTNPTTPQANATDWIPVTPTKNFSSLLPYVLSNDVGNKTVYAWYKDAMGNVSEMASASITLDTIVPVVTITDPTPDAIYTTTDITVSLAGSVMDDGSGVNNVTWKSDKGGSGDARGTTSWTIPDVSLTEGDNRITILTTDKAGNTGLSTITVKFGLEPTVITGTSANVTSVSATLLGTVNGGGLRTSAWFEYGSESGVYENITPAQDVTGATNTELTVDVTGLVEDKEYYYRIVAQNNAGTKRGSEMTLKTPDTTAPVGSILIKDGDAYTSATTVTLKLTATDNVGITGYYLSTSDVIPAATSEGWTDVSPTTSYSAGIQYALSDSDGNKTLYVWYKDEAGNISGTAGDSIDVDTRAPEINIMSPTSDAAYITTAGVVGLSGNAVDTGSVIQSVTWSSDRGRSGEAGGTANWTIVDINLEIGDTVITVTAKDSAGNTGTASMTATYGVVPAVTTASATDVKADTTTLNGMVNAGGLPATAWFEYGTTMSQFDNTTPPQSIGGLTDAPVSADITGLLQSKTYYYRLVAQNVAGTVYGSEKTLKTLDASAPSGSVVINGGDAYTNSTAVRVSLLATDNEEVTGYYFSTNNVTPSATAGGWTNVTPSPSYSESALYTFDSGDGTKTLYVWYKDAAGNISNTISDSIELDTTAPVVVITSPVSGDTYSTTSVLINLDGSASDGKSGISGVIWSTDKNSSGTASGTTNWTISPINLTVGDTVITVTATDGAGNTGMTTITVSYSGAPAQAGLSALYVFDEGSGATALDTSGNGNNGTINDATWTTGKIGSALSFDGTSSYVLLSNTLDAFSEFTCSAWVKADDLSVKRGIFTSGGLNTSGFRFRVNTDGSVWMLMAGGGSYNTVLTAAGVVKSGSFYHITVTGKSGQYMRIYVNGELAKEKVTTQTVTTPTASGYIGTSWSKTSELMKGIIDDVHIYNRALSNQEVLDVYNAR